MNPPDLIGQVCKVHFNLRTHRWSVTKGGLVVANLDDVTLTDVELTVSEAGLRRVKEKGARGVHAWAVGTVIAVDSAHDLTGLTRVSYNPKPKNKDDFDPFFRVATASGLGPVVTEADWLLLAKHSPQAPKGYAWLR